MMNMDKTQRFHFLIPLSILYIRVGCSKIIKLLQKKTRICSFQFLRLVFLQIYCILDMDEGYLAFATDHSYLGVAFRGLQGKTLYPAVSSVWGNSTIAIHYIGGLPGAILRHIVQNTENANKTKTFTSFFSIHTHSSLGAISVQALCNILWFWRNVMDFYEWV